MYMSQQLGYPDFALVIIMCDVSILHGSCKHNQGLCMSTTGGDVHHRSHYTAETKKKADIYSSSSAVPDIGV